MRWAMAPAGAAGATIQTLAAFTHGIIEAQVPHAREAPGQRAAVATGPLFAKVRGTTGADRPSLSDPGQRKAGTSATDARSLLQIAAGTDRNCQPAINTRNATALIAGRSLELPGIAGWAIPARANEPRDRRHAATTLVALLLMDNGAHR